MRLTAGTIVHYVLSNDEHRAAMVTKEPPTGKEEVNLLLFADIVDLLEHFSVPCGLDTRGVHHDEERSPGTWHWPAREGELDRHLDPIIIDGQTHLRREHRDEHGLIWVIESWNDDDGMACGIKYLK